MFDFEKYQKIKEFINKEGKLTEIIAISKNHPFSEVQKAISNGLSLFGENRVQEAKLKFENILINKKNIKLHLTGPLQTNKVKHALDLFDVFHTLDREKLLKELSKFPDKIINKAFFIQVNTGNEGTKSGIRPEEAKQFLQLCSSYGVKHISGLMCIPPLNEDPNKHFQLITSLSEELGLGPPSIGMSSDYLEALKFNPKYIRLGTVLFGKRI